MATSRTSEQPSPTAPPAGPRPVWIAGPTAVGKSAVAIELALRLNGEIVSVDSMQVYRGLDIGTAKPSPADRARIPHHLIDVARLDERFDAARFVRLAREAIASIQGRGRLPIFCGGTGFYFQALRDGVAEAPPADPALRQQLEAIPLTLLLEELRQRDPEACQRIDAANPRRVIRAVEVVRLTGRPFSSLKPPDTAGLGTPEGRAWFLVRSDADLRTRVQARVDAMFAAGLVEETRQLLAAGLADNAVALQAIGYRQVVEHLNGVRSLEATVALVKTRTWQFVRRQRTWFRHQIDLPWISLEPDEPPTETAARLARMLNP